MQYLENLQLGAIVADALQDFLHVVHKAIMENWLVELDMSKVSLALSSLSTGLALLIKCGDSEPEIVGA